jgi:hypothetical protein
MTRIILSSEPLEACSYSKIARGLPACVEFCRHLTCWQFMKNEEAGWGILGIEETTPSLKPKHSFCIVIKEQPLHIVAEFEGIKVF